MARGFCFFKATKHRGATRKTSSKRSLLATDPFVTMENYKVQQNFTRVASHKMSPVAQPIAEIARDLHLDPNETQVIFCANRTSKFRILISIRTHTMARTECLFDNSTGYNLANTSVFHSEWNNRVKRTELPWLQIAAKEPIPLLEKLLFHH